MDWANVWFAMFLGLAFVFFAGLMVWGLVAAIDARREKLRFQAARLRALELGQPFPEETPKPTPAEVIAAATVPEDSLAGMAKTCYSSIVWVAFWGFLFASQSGSVKGALAGVSIAIAVSTGAICVACAICGTILASRSPKATASLGEKLVGDPDVFDVAGMRG